MNQNFVKSMTHWYDIHHRDLPWRHTKDPYRIWLSEIMLQQTRVEAVKGYYERFLRELPTIEDLANCPEDTLLKLWEGLGYYNRVRNLQKAARVMMEQYDGRFPDEYEDILALPGIGEYTAGAISSIAFGKKKPAVDGNVLRVYARFMDLHENILDTSFKKKVTEAARDWVSLSDQPGNFNQSLIELGAIVCLPNGAPLCDVCPVKEQCLANLRGTASDLPVRIKKTKRRVEERTILLIRRGEETVVHRRKDSGLLAGMYEFPSLEGHVSEDAAISYVEEQNLTALRIRPLPKAKHLFSHVTWQMIGYEIIVAMEGFEGTNQAEDWIFADSNTIMETYAIPSAFRAYAEHLAIATGKGRSAISRAKQDDL